MVDMCVCVASVRVLVPTATLTRKQWSSQMVGLTTLVVKTAMTRVHLGLALPSRVLAIFLSEYI